MMQENTAPQPTQSSPPSAAIEAKSFKPHRKKSAANARRPARLKLSRFDADAIKLVRTGTSAVNRISAILGVDSVQVTARLAELEKEGLLSINAQAGTASLTIKAYNELKLKPQKTDARADELRQPETATQVQETLQPSPQAQGRRPQQPAARQAPLLQVESLSPHSHRSLDLDELFRVGAPRQGQPAAQAKQTAREVVIEGKRIDAQTSELLERTLRDYEGEKCELCRGEFRLAVQGGHPKHGYCFCGAAYHRDCYDSLIDSSGNCPRCGKKLEIMLDRQSEEAVKAIRRLFE